MASTDLVFASDALVNPAHLVFGADETPPNRNVIIDVAFGLSVSMQVGPRVETFINATFALSLSSEVSYDSNVQRPLVGQSSVLHQGAKAMPLGRAMRHNDGDATHSGAKPMHQGAIALRVGAMQPSDQGERLHGDVVAAKYQDAIRVPTWLMTARHQDGLRDRRQSRASRFQGAEARRNEVATDFQDRFRDRKPSVDGRWSEALGVRVKHSGHIRNGNRFLFDLGSQFQDAMVPNPGVNLPPEPPGPEPCYEPDPNLLFREVAATDGFLLFRCTYDDGTPDATVTVPIKRVYVVINTISLRRVADDSEIPTLGMSLSIDADSWTWGFSATLPAAELENVMPDSSGPIELEANVNGTLYRVLAERVSRDRSFNSATVKISGRGKSALLSSPYSPLRTFTNNTARTAQQLMADVLTFNDVPVGWDIDWQLDDWLVPSGAFSMNGGYMDGLNAIASAAGAYIQPHPVDQSLSVLHRYPSAPWEWGTVTPDFELPAAVTLQEGIEWDEKPLYNRVYVSGTSQGILARVTRTGTAGDLVASLVTDPLITATAAGRQRGRAVLSDTGRQAKVSLRLPVLSETGVITPGKYVRYNDGSDDRMGIVRSVSVEAGFPEVWQSLVVETHV